MLESLFYKVASLQDCNVTKKDSYTGVFLGSLINSGHNYVQDHLNDCFCVLITSSCIDYAIKIIELMTREAVSFEEVFH